MSLSLQPAKQVASATKDFFHRSETILIARMETVTGFLVCAVSAMDWSPLFGITSFDQKQLYFIGGLTAAKGLVTEWARRRPGDYKP